MPLLLYTALAVFLCAGVTAASDQTCSADSCDSVAARDGAENPFVSVPGGRFVFGTEQPHFAADGEGPPRNVTISAFSLQAREVSNAEFQRFVADTGHVTEVRGGELE